MFFKIQTQARKTIYYLHLYEISRRESEEIKRMVAQG